MKGPSLDAIRKFKNVQELKKKEEEDRKIKNKLAILEHRASQGDRKAKTDLKKIKDALEKPPPETKNQGPSNVPTSKKLSNKQEKHTIATQACKKPKPPANFEDLMRIAQQNASQGPKSIPATQPQAPALKKATLVKKETISTPVTRNPVSTKRPDSFHVRSQPVKQAAKERVPESVPPKSHAAFIAKQASRLPAPHQMPSSFRNDRPYIHRAACPPNNEGRRLVPMSHAMRDSNLSHVPHFRQVRRCDDYYDDEEDEYESDDFVVDEEDDQIQDEVRNTIRSVFNYDKRRCDLRERELDREYRAIGRVSTFEDLEREERRASRLAAVEDAKELRLEEERKRLKMAKRAGKSK